MRKARSLLMVSILCVAGSASSDPVIYRCAHAGTTTFSDRPCEDGAEIYVPENRAVNVYEPVERATPSGIASPVHGKKKAKSSRGGSVAADQARRAAECERVAGSVRELRSRMRAGYRAAEGERIRARLMKLQSQQRALRCR